MAGSPPVLAANVPEPGPELCRRIHRAAASDVSVLVRGPEGPERDAVAHAVHDGSGRAGGPWVVFRCRAVPPDRQVDGLLGGSGAPGSGGVASAEGGTLLLDEVDALGVAAQERLVTALVAAGQKRSGEGPGIDFRVVAATASDIDARVRCGAFRSDLFMRLAVHELVLPGGRSAPPAIDEEDSLKLADRERKVILEALQRSAGNRARASRELGISRSTLYRKLKDIE